MADYPYEGMQADACCRWRTFWNVRIRKPLVALFAQGRSPHKIALCVTLGIGVSLFPIPGVTTLICAALAIVLRLNLPAIQAVNWLFAGAQLVMILPFMRFGEILLGSEPLPLSVDELMAMARTSAWSFLRALGGSLGYAVVGWAVVCIPLAVLVYATVFTLTGRWQAPRRIDRRIDR